MATRDFLSSRVRTSAIIGNNTSNEPKLVFLPESQALGNSFPCFPTPSNW